VVCERHSSALLREQNKVYANNPHTLDKLHQSIHKAIEISELKPVSNNLFKRPKYSEEKRDF
jgi:hypothetical protein